MAVGGVMKLKIGDTSYILISGPKSYKIHIVAVIDDDMIVYKYYGRVAQYWHYEIESGYLLRSRIDGCVRWMKDQT